jgi:hypothetical protein
MATIDITGTIQDAAGNGVQNIAVVLTPEAPAPGGEEAIGGVGLVLTPVTVFTDGSGDFTAPAVQGFRYRLTIDTIGHSRTFRAPSGVAEGTDIRFDLLTLVPAIETLVDWVDADGVDKLNLTVEASPINTVLERFDKIVVEKAVASTGPWNPVTDAGPPAIPFLLETGQSFYTTTIDGVSTDYYRVRYEHTNGDVGQDGAPYLADGDDSDLCISVEELKALYLFGVDLTDSDGTPYPDRMIRHYIEAAIGWVEKELDICVKPCEIVDELHDHLASDYGRWGYFQLRKYPLVIPNNQVLSPWPAGTSPVSVKFQYPTQTTPVIIDDEWIVIEDDGDSGVIQLVPGQGNIADVLLIPGALMPLWSGATGRVPGVWRFSYRAGFEVNQVPPDIKHVIGMAASIGVFNIAGDLIAGAGIANISISVPGLNQNIGTTSSATNSGYGARIIEYQKEIKEAIPNLKRYYGKATKMVVV